MNQACSEACSEGCQHPWGSVGCSPNPGFYSGNFPLKNRIWKQRYARSKEMLKQVWTPPPKRKSFLAFLCSTEFYPQKPPKDPAKLLRVALPSPGCWLNMKILENPGMLPVVYLRSMASLVGILAPSPSFHLPRIYVPRFVNIWCDRMGSLKKQVSGAATSEVNLVNPKGWIM